MREGTHLFHTVHVEASLFAEELDDALLVRVTPGQLNLQQPSSGCRWIRAGLLAAARSVEQMQWVQVQLRSKSPRFTVSYCSRKESLRRCHLDCESD